MDDIEIEFTGEMLTGPENYVAWAIRAQNHLALLECADAIVYDYSKPYSAPSPAAAASGVSVTDVQKHHDPYADVYRTLAMAGPESKDNAERHKRNIKALAILKCIVADGPIVWLAKCTSAKTAWTCLRDMYRGNTFTSNLILIQEFLALQPEIGKEQDFLDKVKYYTDELHDRKIALPKVFIAGFVHSKLGRV